MRRILLPTSLLAFLGSSVLPLAALAASSSPIPESELRVQPLTVDQAGYCGVLMTRMAHEDAKSLLADGRTMSKEEQQARLILLAAKAVGEPVLEPIYKNKLGSNRVQEFKQAVSDAPKERLEAELAWCSERASAVAKSLPEPEREALKEKAGAALMNALGNAYNPPR